MWPLLDTPGWLATCETLHLWTQLVGKTALALAPFTNHWWHVTLSISCRGLRTSPLPTHDGVLEVELDFIDDRLYLRDDRGRCAFVALRPCTLADFHEDYVRQLGKLGIALSLWPVTVELPQRVRLDRDRMPREYDPSWAMRFWQALVHADRALRAFRSQFIGKTSPVHFFWGSFDLAVTRFSGRAAPLYTGETVNVGAHVMQEAYSHEVSSAGFWPGDRTFPEAAFYSYAYPEPAGLAEARIAPSAAVYLPSRRLFILPYAAVRVSPAPMRDLAVFFDATYDAVANLGRWDRSALELGIASLARTQGTAHAPCVENFSANPSPFIPLRPSRPCGLLSPSSPGRRF